MLFAYISLTHDTNTLMLGMAKKNETQWVPAYLTLMGRVRGNFNRVWAGLEEKKYNPIGFGQGTGGGVFQPEPDLIIYTVIKIFNVLYLQSRHHITCTENLNKLQNLLKVQALFAEIWLKFCNIGRFRSYLF